METLDQTKELEIPEKTEVEILREENAFLKSQLANAKPVVKATTKHAVVAQAIENIVKGGVTHIVYGTVLKECKVLGFANSHEVFTILKQQSQSSQVYFPKRSFSLPQERDSWNI